MPTWDDQLRDVLRRDFAQGQAFTLDDVYRYEPYFQRLHPRNNFVRDKLRQVLQHLRDEGTVEFVDDAGTYRLIK